MLRKWGLVFGRSIKFELDARERGTRFPFFTRLLFGLVLSFALAANVSTGSVKHNTVANETKPILDNKLQFNIADLLILIGY